MHIGVMQLTLHHTNQGHAIMAHTINFTFICDPGHGWLQVDFSDLKALGLNPSDFSRYSYRKRNTFYLEEDCDAGKFINAYQARYDHSPHIDETHSNSESFVRNLPSIHS
jgi:hypothetical protein